MSDSSPPPAPPAASASGHAAPPATLRSVALAALAGLAGGAGGEGAPPELDYLHPHRAALGGDGWRRALARIGRTPPPDDAALVRLAGALALTPLEVLAVSLAAAVEDDALAGRAVARLQAPVGGSRPTLALIAAVGAADSRGSTADAAARLVAELATGSAVTSGLLALPGGDVPLAERALAVPAPLSLALRGREGSWPGATVGLEPRLAVPLPHSTREQCRAHARALTATSASPLALLVRSGSPAEARSVAAELCTAMRARPVFLDTEARPGLGPWLLLRDLVPVLVIDVAPGERRVLPSIPGYDGAMLVLAGPDGSVEVTGRTVVSWSLGVPPAAERAELWRDALGAVPLADDLASRYRHGAGRIAHLGRLARHVAALDERTTPEARDVAAAARTGEGGALDALAQPLRDPVPDEALILPPATRGELQALLLRCRAREGLAAELGPSARAKYHPGVRALFVGPSGTGKTLAAGWLATTLGLPLYRVDLAAVTSKYIGETEKNLAQLFARAEQAEVVLLFDEADALFGKRTDVKDANDRFANAQTNYLLQRIESFDGIALLTSNGRGRFDAAFARRLDMIVDFPHPDADERRLLWQSHLGAGHSLGQRDINLLAARADLSGGHIRNAVLAAAVLARAEMRSIVWDDVIAGLGAEYRKLGRHLPVELNTAGADPPAAAWAPR